MVVDLVAVAGRQAALAGLGLLVLYCVPVGTITGGIGLIALAAPAAGLALLLWADQRRRVGRRAGRPSPGWPRGWAPARWPRCASAARRCSPGLIVGAVVPTLAEGSLATGLGGGSGRRVDRHGAGPGRRAAGQLTLPEPIDLLRMDTSVDDPGYLRAVTLDQYDSHAGWTLSNLDGEESIVGNDRLAPLPAAASRAAR